jgi:alpha-tubulin suppressor-like RCC1 family protein
MSFELIALLIIGIAFIAFGLFVLFLPEVIENEKRKKLKEKEKGSKKKLGFWLWVKQRKLILSVITFLLGGALLISSLPLNNASSSLNPSSSPSITSSLIPSSSGETTTSNDSSTNPSSNVETSSSDSSSTNSSSDTSIPTSTQTFIMADVAESHGLALTSTNRVLVWGDNRVGQLGLGESVTTNLVPTILNLPLANNEIVTHVYASLFSSFALTSTMRLFAWGENQLGALGIGTLNDQFEPVEVIFSDFTSGETIAQFHPSWTESYILTTTGRVFGWGYNVTGNLGDGTTFGRTLPTLISFPDLQNGESIANLYIGRLERFAKTTSERIYAWGYNQTYGLGLNDTVNRLTPTIMTFAALEPSETIVSITSGSQSTLALTSTGRVLGWGHNTPTRLGDGGTGSYRIPTVISYSLDGDITAIFSNKNAAFYIITDQQNIYVFGLNGDGNLGVGDENHRPLPALVSIPDLRDGEYVTTLTFSDYSAFALTNEGRLFVWGKNVSGGLGLVSEPEWYLLPTLMNF